MKALSRQRTRVMRTDLYRSLARDLALLRRFKEISDLSEWPADQKALAIADAPGSSPRTALENWLNGKLLEDFHTETYDDWRKAYPTEYLLLPEADIIRDFYKRLKESKPLRFPRAQVLRREDIHEPSVIGVEPEVDIHGSRNEVLKQEIHFHNVPHTVEHDARQA